MRILILSFLMILSLYSSAQLRFGVRSGVNLSARLYNNDYGEKGYSNPVTRFNGGLQIEIPFDENWRLVTGPYYSGKGDNCLPRDTFKTRLNYLEVPLIITYKFSEENLNGFILGGGIYAGYGFCGELSWRGGRPEPTKLLHRNETQRYKRIDLGYNINTQYEWNSNWGVRLDLSYSAFNIYRQPDGGRREKNAVLSLSLFWYFKKESSTTD